MITLEEKKVIKSLKDHVKEKQQSKTITERKPTSLKDQLSDLNEKLEIMAGEGKKSKSKKFKFKYSVRTQMKKAAKKNKLLVFVLGTNRNAEGHIVDVRSGFFMFNGVPRKCTMDYVYLWQGKIPCIFLQEWNLEPIGLLDYYKNVKDGLPSADVQKLVIGALESGEVLTKNKMSPKAMIFAGIGIIIVLYIFLGGGTPT